MLIKKKSEETLREMKDEGQMQSAKRIIKQERKVEKMVIVMTVSFFIIYIPMLILRIIEPDTMITKPASYIACYILNCFIGIVDPLVYVIYQERYRDAVKNLFKWRHGI